MLFERHLNYVCQARAQKAASVDRPPLELCSDWFSGGVAARYGDTSDVYAGHECFIDGMRCEVGEARFGEIVIEAVI